MNAIVVLCHFCEQHGPSVVMCTQPYRHTQSRTQATGTMDYSADTNSISRNASHIGLYGIGTGEMGPGTDSAANAFLCSQDSTPVPLISKSSPSASQHFSLAASPSCRACSFSSRDEPGLMSRDQSAGTTFISTQWPKDQDLSVYVRAACHRSLSCEDFPEPEGAFYFGDEVNGHVVSYNFHVKDSQGRGLQRRYSILVMSWDRVLLLNLWPFLVSNLSRMVSRICSAADRVYETEISNSAPFSSSHRAVSNPAHGARGVTPPPAAVGPFPPVLAGQAIAAAGGGGIYLGGGAGHPIRQKRAIDAEMRSLADLTKDDQIFCRIHAWFTWLLRTGGRRWTALPSVMTPADEDALVEQEERQASVSALGEFVAPGTHLSIGSTTGSSSTTCLPSHLVPNNGSTHPGASTGQSNQHTSSIFPSTGGTSGCSGLPNNNPSIEETTISMMVLIRMSVSLGEKTFSQLIQHVAVGNQIVIQPLSENALGPVVVDAIAKLVPRGCRKQIVSSPDYVPAFQCNLLSLTTDAQPPEVGWNPGDGVLFVAVTRLPQQEASGGQLEATDHLNEISAKYAPFINSLHFKLDSVLPSTDPLFNSFRGNLAKLDDEVAATFPALKPTVPAPTSLSTYTQNVIRLFTLSPPLPPSTLDLALNAARQEWINRARLLYAFKRCQGPLMSGDETTRRWAGVLAAIDCTNPENANVARFWQGALSQHSRQNICHIRRRATNSTNASRKSSRCSSTVDVTAALAAASLQDQ
ncbi:putative Eukaryotictranslation initiation factor [Fasciola gigantica]|uniref:Folliculin n=1 Tax=Fasciola gigantica TaxID=46835 RepID=A0A504Y727_FASGI|nr:putative Eukaryotictranslation initiation factor [Fasciola gigantica]